MIEGHMENLTRPDLRDNGSTSRLSKIVLISSMAIFGIAATIFLVNISIVLYVLFSGTVLLGTIILKKPIIGISVLLITLPFVGTSFFSTTINGISGLKISNLLPVMVFILSYLAGEMKHIRKRDAVFFLGIVSLFFIAILRSTQYMPEYTMLFWKEEFTLSKYILSFFIKPLLLFVPFVVIIGYARDQKSIHRIAWLYVASVFLLSTVMLAYYIFFVPDKTDFESVRSSFMTFLSMHGNGIVDYYVLSFPIVLSMAFYKRNPFVILTLFLSLAIVAILYSRGGYVSIGLAVVLFFLISRRALWLPFIGCIGFLSFKFLPSSIVSRVSYGFFSEDLNNISAGRTSNIWLPVVNEYISNPLKLIFGAGRYGYVGSDAFSQGKVLSVTHAHNMYLDTIFDVGLVGLAFFLVFIGFYLHHFWVQMRIEQKSFNGALLLGIIVALVSYMIRGMTDGFLLPETSNAFLWIILALGISIMNLREDAHHGENTGSAQFIDNRGS